MTRIPLRAPVRCYRDYLGRGRGIYNTSSAQVSFHSPISSLTRPYGQKHHRFGRSAGSKSLNLHSSEAAVKVSGHLLQVTTAEERCTGRKNALGGGWLENMLLDWLQSLPGRLQHKTVKLSTLAEVNWVQKKDVKFYSFIVKLWTTSICDTSFYVGLSYILAKNGSFI